MILYIKYLPNLTFLDSSNEMWNMNTKIACHLHHFLINLKKNYHLRLLHLSLTQKHFMKKIKIKDISEKWSVPEGSAVVSQWRSPSLRWIHAQRPWSKEQLRCPVSVEYHTMAQKSSWQELNTILEITLKWNKKILWNWDKNIDHFVNMNIHS